MQALSVRQPWAWLLFHGKPVENRDWRWDFRGPLAIHASGGCTKWEYEDAVDFVCRIDIDLARQIPSWKSLERGRLIGTVRMIGCVDHYESPWFQGKYGHLYSEPREFASPIEAKGLLGPWQWTPPAPLETLWRAS